VFGDSRQQHAADHARRERVDGDEPQPKYAAGVRDLRRDHDPDSTGDDRGHPGMSVTAALPRTQRRNSNARAWNSDPDDLPWSSRSHAMRIVRPGHSGATGLAEALCWLMCLAPPE